MRMDKHNYYLNIAQEALRRGTCLRRNYGAVIVKDNEVIATGYTGSPRGCIHCIDTGICMRKELNIPSGQRYELCKSVHAEVNACISASRKNMIGATMYLCGWEMEENTLNENTMSCDMCKRVIINAGIKQVVIRRTIEDFDIYDVKDWLF